MPAPPARMRSASVPWGESSISSVPLDHCSSTSGAELPGKTPIDTIALRTMPALMRMPGSSRSARVPPQELQMMVRSLTPRSRSASTRACGYPAMPKPAIMMLAPSGTSATASAGLV